MKLAFYIARRYLFSKKTRNAINIISLISVMGILVSTAAMVVVLSAFNGIEGIVETLYSSFDADIKVAPVKGKTFDYTEFPKAKITEISAVETIAFSLEEIALFSHGENWVTAQMKGVDTSFIRTGKIKEAIEYGDAILFDETFNYTILGMGVQNRLGVNLGYGLNEQVKIHTISREKEIKRNTDPFNKQSAIVSGIFSINPDFDYNYVLVPFDMAANLLNLQNEASYAEISLSSKANSEQIAAQISEVLGDGFEVKTRYQQNELIYKTNKAEKWITFVILAFIMGLSAFNVIASLTMLIIEKKEDVKVLRSIGFTDATIRNIFFYEGMLINFSGLIGGLALGLVICFLQMKFHLIKLEGSVVDYYPVEVKTADLALIILSVLVLALLTTYLPVKLLAKNFLQKK
ncbi:MAG: ABC transporter permease [Flavobacteriales bacterium]